MFDPGSPIVWSLCVVKQTCLKQLIALETPITDPLQISHCTSTSFETQLVPTVYQLTTCKWMFITLTSARNDLASIRYVLTPVNTALTSPFTPDWWDYSHKFTTVTLKNHRFSCILHVALVHRQGYIPCATILLQMESLGIPSATISYLIRLIS